MSAHADQQRGTSNPLAIAPDLSSSPPYKADTTSAASFTDVTSGTNGSCGTDCTAAAGYDLVTGVGTPVANKLLSNGSTIGTLVSP